MSTPYIPARDSLFSEWVSNFSTLISATPSAFGLVAGDAAQIAAVNSGWQAAYTAAINPSTRTPATVAAKDAARAAAEMVVRPYAILIRNNSGISNLLKISVGVTVVDLTPTAFPPPVTNPALILVAATPGQHQLAYRDSLDPLLKRKPVGVVGLEVFRALGTVAATDPAQTVYIATVTKTPFVLPTPPADAGKIASYYGRWTTRSGPGGIVQVGPWSTRLQTVAI